MPKPGDAPASAKTATLNSWEAALFHMDALMQQATHVYNTGDCGVTVSYQAGAAQPAYVFIDPGEDHREYGFWVTSGNDHECYPAR